MFGKELQEAVAARRLLIDVSFAFISCAPSQIYKYEYEYMWWMRMLVHTPHVLYFHLVYPSQLFCFLLNYAYWCFSTFAYEERCMEVKDCQYELTVSEIKSAKQSGCEEVTEEQVKM